MNSAVTTEILRHSCRTERTKRDIHKHVWQLSIETYDQKNPTHTRLIKLGRAAEATAATFEVETEPPFCGNRRHMRERLEASEVGIEISQIVEEMLS